jgi:hypothetical protein
LDNLRTNQSIEPTAERGEKIESIEEGLGFLRHTVVPPPAVNNTFANVAELKAHLDSLPDPDDDLGELDPGKACNLDNPDCESCS